MEYLLSHKINALKLITEARTTNIKKETRAEAAFMLAQIMESVGGLASNRKIFNLYHIAATFAPHTEFGAQAAAAQVNMIERGSFSLDEIPVAGISRLLKLMQNHVQRPAWQKAGFTPDLQIREAEKKKILHTRIRAAIDHHKLLRQNPRKALEAVQTTIVY